MAKPTPAEIASWPLPNFKDPVTRDALVLGATAPTMALAIIFTALRLYGKGVLQRALGRDDWMMLVATTFSVPVSLIAMISLRFGLARHLWDQKPEWAPPYGKMALIADVLFTLSCSITKISLCFTYLRLFPSKTDKRFCWALTVFVSSYTIASIFPMIFQCHSLKSYWYPSENKHCINIHVTLVTIAALNSVSDFLVYLWPAKPLWSLQLPLKQRLGLICIFAVGFLVCVAGALRIYYLEVYFENYDALWIASVIYSVMSVEMNLGIICGCLSGVKPVLAVAFPKYFASTRARTGSRRSTDPKVRGPRAIVGAAQHQKSNSFQPLSEISTRSTGKKGGGNGVRLTGVSTDSSKHEHNGGADAVLPDPVNFTLEASDFGPEDEFGAADQGHFAWASASGSPEVDVPENAIAVNSVVSVQEDAIGPLDALGIKVVEREAPLDEGDEVWVGEDGGGRSK